MNCKICGKFSGFYPLCNDCFALRDKGEILKCDDCGTWYKNGNKCKCEPKPCIICEKTQNKAICNECNTLIQNEKNQIRGSFKLNELMDNYYQLKFSALSFETNESFHNALIKMDATAQIVREAHHDHSLQIRLLNDIKNLKDKRLENLNKQNEKNENNITNNNDKLDQVESDYRKLYPAIYRCNDGHYVRSKSERDIDNFLYDQKIWHEYEKEEYDPSTKETYYIDFYLPEYNIYIEHFGLNNNSSYKEKSKRKIDFFNRLNLIYIETTEDNSNTIHEFLKKKIKDIEFDKNIKILIKR